MTIKKLYLEGFVPGPGETSSDFKKRVASVRKIIEDPLAIMNIVKKVSFNKLSPSLLSFRSNKKLPFWTAAMTWVITLDDGIKLPLIQLPTKKRKFCFAKEEEIVAHEKVHALRAAFKEPIFEEIIAYQTSPSKFRCYFGPIFSNNKESLLFLISIAISLLTSMPLIPPAVSTLFLLRLLKRQRTFSKAKKNLSQRYENPVGVLTLLSDQEIIQAANNQLHFLLPNSIRMDQIKTIFEKQLTDDR